jgi:hypothetical protein
MRPYWLVLFVGALVVAGCGNRVEEIGHEEAMETVTNQDIIEQRAELEVYGPPVNYATLELGGPPDVAFTPETAKVNGEVVGYCECPVCLAMSEWCTNYESQYAQ